MDIGKPTKLDENNVIILQLPHPDFCNKAVVDENIARMGEISWLVKENKPIPLILLDKKMKDALEEVRAIFRKDKEAKITLLIIGGKRGWGNIHPHWQYRLAANRAFIDIINVLFMSEGYCGDDCTRRLFKDPNCKEARKLDREVRKKFNVPSSKAFLVGNISLRQLTSEEKATYPEALAGYKVFSEEDIREEK